MFQTLKAARFRSSTKAIPLESLCRCERFRRTCIILLSTIENYLPATSNNTRMSPQIAFVLHGKSQQSICSFNPELAADIRAVIFDSSVVNRKLAADLFAR
jgi:hypothetical protein